MGKRIADKQLTQLNQYEDDAVEDTGFHMAAQEKLSQRVIKKPRSRIRGAVASTAGGQQPTTPGAFSGFSGFGSPVSIAAASDSTSTNVTPTPAAAAATTTTTTTTTDGAQGGGGSDATPKGLFKGFSFAQTPVSTAAKPTTAPSFGAAASFGTSTGSTLFGAGSFGSTNDNNDKSDKSEGATQPTTSFANPFLNVPKKSGAPTFSFGASNKAPMAAEKSEMETNDKPSSTGGFSMPAFKPPTLGASTSGSSMFSGPPKQSSFTSPFAPPKPANDTPLPATAASNEKMGQDEEEEFYRNIRGLNVSLKKKIDDAISVNAFVDLTPLLEQYATHWNLVTKKKQKNQVVSTNVPKPDTITNKPATTTTGFTPMSGGPPAAPSPFAFLQKPTGDSQPAKDKRSASIADTISPSAPSPKSPPVSTPFKFGATNTSGAAKSTFAFSFGKPPLPQQSPDVAKKPFSFGFQQKPASPATTADPAQASKPVFTFGFGGANAATKEPPVVEKPAVEEDNDETDEPSSPKKPSTAGEEGEATEHQVRAKIYVWDGAVSKYKDMGVGQLRVNTWQPTGSDARRARILCRQEGSNKVTLNASLFKEMIVEYTQGKKELGFLVIVDAKPTRYLVRTSSADSTASLHECIDRIKSTL
ncbi:hypothetical protein EV175_005685 [Coemansia sp. RSA 1933]|nr:hypothetical protein EV175_005685 [Coemansia sp. RSA 1933]